jgi:hypothetical protein
MEAKGPVSKKFSNAVLQTIVAAVLVVAGNAYASLDRTTYEEWSFSGPGYGPLPPDEGWNNSFGDPCLSVGGRATWSDGAWALNTDKLDIFIPNYSPSEPTSWKEMFVWLTWKEAGLNSLPDYPIVAVAPVGRYKTMTIEPGEDVDLGDGWMSTLFAIHIWPNPPSEWIFINGDVYIDNVLVDTSCVPEPGTLSLLGLSVLFGLKRKRSV